MATQTQCPRPGPYRNSTLLTIASHWNSSDHGRAWLGLFCFVLFLMAPATAQTQNSLNPPPQDPFYRLRFDKTMAIVLVILVVVFFILGFVSIYTRQCTERRLRARLALTFPVVGIGSSDRRQSRGLDPEIIDTFPIVVYSAVKGLKIGRTALECAVCLNEFLDHETLRLIPRCSHVFHSDCIDVWLATHSTCPVCRANLIPKPNDVSSSVAIEVPDPGDGRPDRTDPESYPEDAGVVTRDNNDDDRSRVLPTESPSYDQNRLIRSKSARFGFTRFFPRSHSTGHLLVQPGENCERFTLRLPEDVRNRLVNSASTTLSRTKSCGVTLQRESSGRRGYRTRSFGSYERFDGESRLDRWGFMWTPPFVGRTGSTKSTTEANNKVSVAMDEVDVEERLSDRLFFPRSEV